MPFGIFVNDKKGCILLNRKGFISIFKRLTVLYRKQNLEKKYYFKKKLRIELNRYYFVLFEGEKMIDFGYSPMKTEDANKYLNFRLKKNSSYRVVLNDPVLEGNQKEISYETGEENNEVLKLFVN